MSSLEISTVLAAPPARVFSAWLDSCELGALIGGGQALVEPAAGGRFVARDGYIQGHIMDLRPYHQIVQNWRTPDLVCCCADSLLALLFTPHGGCGTRLTVEHTQIPEALLAGYRRAWQEEYLERMRRYFAEGSIM